MNKIKFYDVESTNTIFTVSFYDNKENSIEIYYLHEDPNFKFDKKKLDKIIYKRNKNFTGIIHEPEDLRTLKSSVKLGKLMGLEPLSGLRPKFNKGETLPVINHMTCKDEKITNVNFNFKTDLDETYNVAEDYYIMGYNSYNYDNTIMALYFQEIFKPRHYNEHSNEIIETMFQPLSPDVMRAWNDDMFHNYINSMTSILWNKSENNSDASEYFNTWERSGRYVDIAKLNEKQSKVGLKRLLGTLGYQILESEILNDDHISEEDIYELVAYNVSDIVNLELLFNTSFYKNNFELKRNLLKTYPQTIYAFDKSKDDYVDRNKVLQNRCTINTTSSNMSAQIVSYGQKLKDVEFVSFEYLGSNVLEDSLKLLEKQFGKGSVIYDNFKTNIYNYYKKFEGKNFNNSNKYVLDYCKGGFDKIHEPLDPYSIEKPGTNTIFHYYYKNGNKTTCYSNFSIGGVHGEEMNARLYVKEYKEWKFNSDTIKELKENYTPLELKEKMPKEWKKYIKSGTTIKELKENPKDKSFYKEYEKPEYIITKGKGKDKGKVKTKYSYTSYGTMINEDFSSYYTSILSNMKAFYNKHIGKDMCKEIYQRKEELDILRKDKNITEEERKAYNDLREGTKLILNSLTGLADSDFNTPIRMNNNILSMRMIGQLMTWRIGQALAYEGAKIVSTNTDGLYSYGLSDELNNSILKETSDPMGIKIEPEKINLISRNSNIRLSFTDEGKIIKGSGVALTCAKGVSVTNKVTKPAIIDWALAEYLIYASKNDKFTEEFNENKGLEILKSAFEKFDKFELLKRFGYIVASSPSSNTYIVAKDKNKDKNDVNAYKTLPRYNRIFFVNEIDEEPISLTSVHAKAITPATQRKREKDNDPMQSHNPIALKLLKSYGLNKNYFVSNPNKEATFKKIPNVDTDWHITIENHNLTEINQDALLEKLDINKYNEILKSNYENNWRNTI